MLQEHDGVRLKTSGSVSLEAFKTYYMMRASAIPIHRESTDSLIQMGMAKLHFPSYPMLEAEKNKHFLLYTGGCVFDNSYSGSLRYNIIAIFILYMDSKFYAGVLAAEVNLRVHGPHNPDFIALCPDLDYVVSVECSVRDDVSLEWKLSPVLRQNANFITDDTTGEYPRQTSVTIILSKSDNPIKSQFHVSSSVLRNPIIDQGEPLTIIIMFDFTN